MADAFSVDVVHALSDLGQHAHDGAPTVAEAVRGESPLCNRVAERASIAELLYLHRLVHCGMKSQTNGSGARAIRANDAAAPCLFDALCLPKCVKQRGGKERTR